LKPYVNLCELLRASGGLDDLKKPLDIWLKVRVKAKQQFHFLSSLLHTFSSKNESVKCLTAIVIPATDLFYYLTTHQHTQINSTTQPTNMNGRIKIFLDNLRFSNISLVVSLTTKDTHQLQESSSLEYKWTSQLFQKILSHADFFLLQLSDIKLEPSPASMQYSILSTYNALGVGASALHSIIQNFPPIKPVIEVKVVWKHRDNSQNCDTKTSVSTVDVWDAIHSAMYINRIKAIGMRFLNSENVEGISHGGWNVIPGPKLDDVRAYVVADKGNNLLLGVKFKFFVDSHFGDPYKFQIFAIANMKQKPYLYENGDSCFF